MECFPPCKTCTGKCKVPVAARRESKPRKAPEKKGYTELKCGHTVPLANVYITTLGAGLGSMEIWCDRHGEFFPKAPAKRKKKAKGPSDSDVPLF
jgi:hypothetical protein